MNKKDLDYIESMIDEANICYQSLRFAKDDKEIINKLKALEYIVHSMDIIIDKNINKKKGE